MAQEKLEILLTAKDETGPAFDAVEGHLENIQNTLAAEALARVQDAAVELFRQTTLIIGDFVTEAGKAQLVGAQLDSQLKAMGGAAAMSKKEIEALGEQISKTTMFDDEMVVSAESVLLRFTSIGHDIFPMATRATADLAQSMGTDMTSAARMLGRALEDPTRGMDALRRSGVVFTTAESDMIKAMAKAGDVAGAQVLMLQALENRIGGAAEAAGETFPGQVKIMETSIENFKEKIGTWFIEFFMSLPKPVRDVGLAIGIIAPQVGGLGSSIIQLAIALMQLKAAGGIASLVAGSQAAATGLSGMAAAEGAAAAGAVALTLPLALLALAVGALVAVVIINFDTLKTEFIQVATVIGAVIKRITFEIDQLLAKLGPVGTILVKSMATGVAGGLGAGPIMGAAQGISQISKATAPAAVAPVTINYSPGMSMGNKSEFESVLIPLLQSALRKINRGAL